MTRIALGTILATLVLAAPLPDGILHGPASAQNKEPVADPSKCPDLWKAIGLPDRRMQGKDKFTIVCHLGYITGHNNDNKTPDWVIEHVTPKMADPSGPATRESQDFRPDDLVKKSATSADYDGSGFDQGHQAPAADFKGDQKFLDDTFFYSNSVPQVGAGFNRSIWRSLETRVRKLSTDSGRDIYVITGPVYQESKQIKVPDACDGTLTLAVPDKRSICPENSGDSDKTCTAGVAVPAALYKIVYDAKAASAFGILMENKSHTGEYKSSAGFEYIKKHAVKIATIEDLTGLTFFTAFDTRRQRQLKQNCVTFKFR
jgi:endonuclease G